MEAAFIRAIRLIEAETGVRPKRIDMPDGRHTVMFMGVELLLSTPQWTKLISNSAAYKYKEAVK